MTDFFELHSRSAFSFLSSGSLPEDLVRRAAELNLPGLALIDRDSVSGAVRFHLEAKEVGMKSIIGAEITMEDKTLLPLLPLNLKGYQNLCKLITTIKLRAKKGEHFAVQTDIENYAEGLLCLTGGSDGFLANSIRNKKGKETLNWLKDVFNDRLYLELQRHHSRSQEDINQRIIRLSQKFKIPCFASNGVYYAEKTDRAIFDVFTCIKNHLPIEKAGKLLSENGERYLKSKEAMLDLFADYPMLVERTGEIASRIGFSLDELGYSFPDYPVASGETMNSLLRQLTEKGAIWRYGAINEKVRSKLDYELNLIAKLKLAGYFLVVWDISEFCRQNNIMSQGRGSAANSVVCYSLGITAVDPIAADLLFERFLSEERSEYPDIDIDLPSGDDREKVIQHVYQKYGERGAGMTANVITYRSRSAIREVGKVFGFAEEELGRLSKLIPSFETNNLTEIKIRLSEAGFCSAEITDEQENNRFNQFLLMFRRILDFPRHLGQHSGGMVISLGRLDGVVPLEPASMENRNIIQWDKDDCEQLGIIKVDLLGLGMMAVLRDTITLIKEHRNEEVDLAQIPKNDPLVYQTLQNADTIGMFQVESRAQINFLPKSKPENFYDLVVQVAIIRPGPIVGKMLSSYIKRRQGIEPIDYMDPLLEPILKRTLGVPLFQEQLLRMAMTIAGFTGGEAEELRRALGFKRANKRLEKIEKRLREGMSERNIDLETQNKITHSIIAFANYGFPESHAASFALLTYASAYLKVHYLDAYTCAMLNNYPLGFYVPATLVKDAQRHGLLINPIDINLSNYYFTIENLLKVRSGLRYVKGLRKETAEAIILERNNGDFISVDDLVNRVPLINKKEIRNLSLAGALNFNNRLHRREALWQAEESIQPKGELYQHLPTRNKSFPYLQKMTGKEEMETDLRTTGLNIGDHPLAFIRQILNKQGVIPASETNKLKKKDIVSVAGSIIVRQRPGTAKKVVFITMEDETGCSNFIVMPDTFERFREVIINNNYLLIRGIVEEGNIIKGLFFQPIKVFNTGIGSHDFH